MGRGAICFPVLRPPGAMKVLGESRANRDNKDTGAEEADRGNTITGGKEADRGKMVTGEEEAIGANAAFKATIAAQAEKIAQLEAAAKVLPDNDLDLDLDVTMNDGENLHGVLPALTLLANWNATTGRLHCGGIAD